MTKRKCGNMTILKKTNYIRLPMIAFVANIVEEDEDENFDSM